MIMNGIIRKIFESHKFGPMMLRTLSLSNCTIYNLGKILLQKLDQSIWILLVFYIAIIELIRDIINYLHSNLHLMEKGVDNCFVHRLGYQYIHCWNHSHLGESHTGLMMNNMCRHYLQQHCTLQLK